MRRLRAFLVDELLLAQAVPGFLLCVGWAVMYEIYHEDGSYYTTLMQEILGGDGLFPYFLVSALLMAFPTGVVIDSVREVVGERWLRFPRTRAARGTAPSPLQIVLQPLLPLDRFDGRYSQPARRAALLTPAKVSGNLALVLLALSSGSRSRLFACRVARLSMTFIIGTPLIGTASPSPFRRYTTGLASTAPCS
jgi:hypothetical protein